VIAAISARRAALYAWQATRDELGRIIRCTETIDGTTISSDTQFHAVPRHPVLRTLGA
jgi:hypothetical protein